MANYWMININCLVIDSISEFLIDNVSLLVQNIYIHTAALEVFSDGSAVFV